MKNLKIYKHYKWNYYVALWEMIDDINGETYVVYKSMYKPFVIWIRPKEMFFEEVEIDWNKAPRFDEVWESFENILEAIDINNTKIIHTEEQVYYKIKNIEFENNIFYAEKTNEEVEE